MKKGMSWQEFKDLAARAEAAKRDYEVRTEKLHVVPHEVKVNGGTIPSIGLHVENLNQTFRLGTVAHDNLAALTGIPRNYYGRLLAEHPARLAELAEMHLREDKGIPAERFVRTIGDRARALLSTRYGVLDHVQVAQMLESMVPQAGGQVASVLVTERVASWQFQFPKFEAIVQPRLGDVVRAGVMISNSEVGLGMFRMSLLLYVLACLNGAEMPGRGGWKFERVHRGSPDSRILADYAQDRLAALPGTFQDTIDLVRRADGVYIPEEAMAGVVDRVRTQHQLTVDESAAVLEEFYGAGRWTGWGLTNAVNFQAHAATADRSLELERISGAILEAY